MKPIEIKIPAGAEIVNFIYPDMAPDDYTQDLVTVSLPNGYFVDAGWYPEGDPMGCFVVRVFYQDWAKQQLPGPFKTRSLRAMIEAVQNLAERFARRQVALGTPVEQHSVNFG